MGASESTEIQVSFNHPNLFYFAGEQISGTISFQSTYNKLTLDGIFLEFIGELGYTTREVRRYNDTYGHTRTRHYRQYHQIPFMNVRIPVSQPQHGQREITLYRGQHSWPFEFVLPQYLPPSLIPSTGSYPYVKYYARIVLDKPWYKPNAKQVYPLTIFPRVNLLQVPGGQQTVAFLNKNRKEIRLQGCLIQGGVVPGENLSVKINLKNPKQCKIKRIEARLIQRLQVAQNYHDKIISRMNFLDRHEFTGAEFCRTFNLPVPFVCLAPSYKFMEQSNYQTHKITISYELELKVKSYGTLTDFDVKIPVIIGTGSEPDQPPSYGSIQIPHATASISDYDEPPPSYETVVANDRE